MNGIIESNSTVQYDKTECKQRTSNSIFALNFSSMPDVFHKYEIQRHVTRTTTVVLDELVAFVSCPKNVGYRHIGSQNG